MLKAAGCDVIRAEKASGTRRNGRTELQVLLDFLRPGDTLVVTRVDRLARSIRDLQDIAMWTAFPSSDYYDRSVAISLAARRRSRVRTR